jgi:hypothetical protein
MAEVEFERRLHRLFAETPGFGDGTAFTLRLQDRLNRGWAWRRTLITATGVLGGAVAVLQLAGSHLVRWAAATPLVSVVSLRQAGSRLLAATPLPIEAIRAVPIGGEGMWLLAGLAVVGFAVLATRLFEEI